MENNTIEFYCKKCRKSFKISYTLTEDDEALVLTNISLKCHTCKKVSRLMKYTEGFLRTQAENGIFYV